MPHYRSAPYAALVLVAALLLNGCAETNLAMHAVKNLNHREPDVRPKPVYKVGQPYQVDGVWYYPAENWRYSANGVASWYGDNFHGRVTANGEIYDKMALTAAHPTLPMPSKVRVTNLRNGRTLDLRVNDRGPFVANRVIDVSQRAAQILGFEQDGTAPVRVQILADESQQLKLLALNSSKGAGDDMAFKAAPIASVQVAEMTATPVALRMEPRPESRPLALQVLAPVAAPAPMATSAPARASSRAAAPAPAPANGLQQPSGMYVQAGAFRSYENAAALRRRLSPIGTTAISQSDEGERTWYLVRIGPVASKNAAESVKRQVAQAGIADARLVSVVR